jgi:hypothetical protein
MAKTSQNEDERIIAGLLRHASNQRALSDE